MDDLHVAVMQMAQSPWANDDGCLTYGVLRQVAGVEGPPALLFIYGGAMIGLMLLVAVVYFNRGVLCCARILAYLLAISTVPLTVKNVYTNYNYKFSKFITIMHFLSGGALCFGIMYWRKVNNGKRFVVPSQKQFLCMILPIALSFASSIGANNMALRYVSAGFAEMVASAGPVTTAMISVAMGMQFPLAKLWPLLVVTAGMTMCATGEVQMSLMGFGLAFYAVLARSMKATLQHKLLAHADEGEASLDPIELLAWMCVPSIIVMIVWSILTEGIEPYTALAQGNGLAIMGAILVTCFNACVLNVANLFVIKDLGAVATQLCAQLKGILVILGGMAVFGEHIAILQGVGFMCELGGVFWYNKTDEALKAAEKQKINENNDVEKSGGERKPLLK